MLLPICVTFCSLRFPALYFLKIIFILCLSLFWLNVCAWCPWRPDGGIWPSGISYRGLWAVMWVPCASLQFLLLLLDPRGSQHLQQTLTLESWPHMLRHTGSQAGAHGRPDLQLRKGRSSTPPERGRGCGCHLPSIWSTVPSTSQPELSFNYNKYCHPEIQSHLLPGRENLQGQLSDKLSKSKIFQIPWPQLRQSKETLTFKANIHEYYVVTFKIDKNTDFKKKKNSWRLESWLSG